MPVRPEGETIEARFVERPNRFIVVAEAVEDDRRIRAHCPNPGRLTEMLHEDNPYLLRRRPNASPEQATEHSVVAAKDPRFHVGTDLELGQTPPEASFEDAAWVLLDTSMANKLVADALANGELADLAGTEAAYRTEPRVEHGRFDFALAEGATGTERMVEVKSVTLVGEDGRTGLFPDAPTARGLRHVQALSERARQGEPVTLLFVAFRTDVDRIAPNAVTDRAFAGALREARQAGVDLQARSLVVHPDWSFELGDRIPVMDVSEVDVGGSLEDT